MDKNKGHWKDERAEEMSQIFTCNFASEWRHHISAENAALSLNKNQTSKQADWKHDVLYSFLSVMSAYWAW